MSTEGLIQQPLLAIESGDAASARTPAENLMEKTDSTPPLDSTVPTTEVKNNTFDITKKRDREEITKSIDGDEGEHAESKSKRQKTSEVTLPKTQQLYRQLVDGKSKVTNDEGDNNNIGYNSVFESGCETLDKEVKCIDSEFVEVYKRAVVHINNISRFDSNGDEGESGKNITGQTKQHVGESMQELEKRLLNNRSRLNDAISSLNENDGGEDKDEDVMMSQDYFPSTLDKMEEKKMKVDEDEDDQIEFKSKQQNPCETEPLKDERESDTMTSTSNKSRSYEVKLEGGSSALITSGNGTVSVTRCLSAKELEDQSETIYSNNRKRICNFIDKLRNSEGNGDGDVMMSQDYSSSALDDVEEKREEKDIVPNSDYTNSNKDDEDIEEESDKVVEDEEDKQTPTRLVGSASTDPDILHPEESQASW